MGESDIQWYNPEYWSVCVAERSEHGVAGVNPAGSEILLEPKLRFIAQSFHVHPSIISKSLKYCWKGCNTLTHPSITQNSHFFGGKFY